MLNNPIIKFEHFDSVSNPNSMHGIYPYRGKISALDAASIISQLPKTGTLLDPFCGSGTIVYEAQKHGLTALGVDNNPLAIQIAKAKVFKGTKESIRLCESIVDNYLQHFRKLFEHIIYGNIKTRYNVFRKYANDVFNEKILQDNG